LLPEQQGDVRVNVRIPTPLRSYTAQASKVEAEGTTLDEVLRDLDRRFPGLRFRVVDEQGNLRKHMRVFVNAEMARDLGTPVSASDEVTLMQALSGG
jgi:molybdopterin converting factor small subunit